MCLFLEPLICGGAKSTDFRALGFWTDGRTHRHNFEKGVFQNLLAQFKSDKKRGRKHTHAFCHARTESIPAVSARAAFCFRTARFLVT